MRKKDDDVPREKNSKKKRKKKRDDDRKKKEKQKRKDIIMEPSSSSFTTSSFSASLSHLPLKYLFKTLGCCAKISPEVLIEAHPTSGLRVKAVNQNHSAFLSCILRTNAFDGYECTSAAGSREGTTGDGEGVQTALLAKHVLGCLRSNRVDRVRIKVKESNGEKVEIVCTGGGGREHAGGQKTYNIFAIQDAEHLAAEVDSDSMLVQIVFKARSLGKFLGSHFNVGTQQDVTFTFYNSEWEGDGSDATTTGTGANNGSASMMVNAFSSKQSRGGGSGGNMSKQQHKAKKCVEISSYVDKKAEQNVAGGPFQQLQTTVHLDANEEAILRYENRQYDKEFVKVTINLKDTLAMVKLCESTEQDVLMSCDKDGDPVSLRPTREFAGGHFASSEQQIYGGGNEYPRGGIPQFDFDAEMVLAAMLPDEEEEDDDDAKRKDEAVRRFSHNTVPPQTPGSVVPPSQTTENGSVRPSIGIPSENNNNNIVWDGDDDEEEVTATPADEEMSKRHKSS